VESDNKIIAVTGATGQQGGHVARALLAHGWRVRALTRDASKPAAQALAGAGAEVVPGDLDDPAQLEAAFAGAYGVFSVQNFWLPNVGYEGEIRQGKAVADAAQAAGVRHLVYSSVGAAHRGEGQKHFESKWLIEQHLHALDLPWTILRPVAFVDNNNWRRPQISNGVYPGMGLPAAKGFQTVAAEDIGAFTALIFENPQEFIGQTIEFAGDELTEAEMAEAFARVIGRPVQVQSAQMAGGRMAEPEMAAMYRFFNGEAYTADIAALRRRFPGLRTFEQYLRDTGWENMPVLPLPPDGR